MGKVPAFGERVLPERRSVVALATAVATAAASIFFMMFAAPAANAASLCGNPPAAGWTKKITVTHPNGPGIKIELWQSGSSSVIRIGNTVANGKANLLATVSTISTMNDNRGRTGTIGVAPKGGWCSNPGSAFYSLYFWVGYDIGSNGYTLEGRCWVVHSTGAGTCAGVD
ncbi:hypothetical protein I6A84_25905 [Frankia sp. CNm7]|uniref:Uncharacterized protein n=1 Tax=Frankia nepalensis TaxID=1836974 RepID=A0A937UMM0_9ACTN|nr:hypothetical protein [Frankia nepalensis]MBL7501655.1 hypothetical protein [Frankia nepalensis]MBL7512587.1 hypothetical protein [Frankia nepalensis]MBL7521424.1 hypothetical protein [Frankia nepalensis]MBL7627208.1 hypothetical protein [Frankia nepalensis]